MLNFCSVAPSSTSDLSSTAVVCGEQRIKQFVNGNRLIFLEARAEILALEHARQTIVAAEPHHVVARHLAEPFAVVADFGFFAVENLVDLLEIRFCVSVHLLARERRARFGLARGVADHGRKIADQENGGVAHVLEMFQLAQDHGVAEVNVGSGGIDAEIDAQRLASFHAIVRASREVQSSGMISAAPLRM